MSRSQKTPATLPIAVEIPEDYRIFDDALEAIALLCIETAERALAAEQEQPRDDVAI